MRFALALTCALALQGAADPACDASLERAAAARLSAADGPWLLRCTDGETLEVVRVLEQGRARARVVSLSGVSEDLRVEVVVLAAQALLRAPAPAEVRADEQAQASAARTGEERAADRRAEANAARTPEARRGDASAARTAEERAERRAEASAARAARSAPPPVAQRRAQSAPRRSAPTVAQTRRA